MHHDHVREQCVAHADEALLIVLYYGTSISYHVSEMELISEGDTVLIQRDKTYRTFVLKKGRWVCPRVAD